MTLTEQMQQMTDVKYVDIVAHLIDLSTTCDSIVAVYGGWND